jgi:hypothetical protein
MTALAKLHPAEPAEEFLGLTSKGCCVDCVLEHCVISGKPHCAHPRKRGVPAIDEMNPDIKKRCNRARKALALDGAIRGSQSALPFGRAVGAASRFRSAACV